MLGVRTTRSLPNLARRLTSSRPSSLLLNSTSSHRFQQHHEQLLQRSLSTCLSSPSFSQSRDEERRNHHRHIAALPRISLLQQYPSMRFSTTTTEDKKNKAESSSSESFREQMEDRKEQGLLAMASGREMAKKYGPVFAGTYLAVYVATVAGLFVGIESGALDPGYVLSMVSDNADEAKSTVQVIIDFMENHTITKPWAPFVERNPEIANLAVAWIATKFTEPIRLVISAAIVPKVHRTLGYKVEDSTGKDEDKADVNDDDKDTSSTEKEDEKNNSNSTEKERKDSSA